MSNVNERLENLAMSLVEADSADGPVLDALRCAFAELAQELSVQEPGIAAEVAVNGTRLLKECRSGERSDVDAVFAVLCRGVTALQSVLVNGHGVHDVEFPAELFPGDSETQCAESELSATDSTAESIRDITEQTCEVRVTETLDATLQMIFAEELEEHLDVAEDCLLRLDETPDNADDLASVFRAFHTIKGSASLSQIDYLVPLAHEIESLLDDVRRGKTALRDGELNVVFQTVDVFREQLERIRDAGANAGKLTADDAMIEAERAIRRCLQTEDVVSENVGSKSIVDESAALDVVATDPVFRDDDNQAPAGMDQVQDSNNGEILEADDDLSMFSMDPEMLAVFVSEATEHLDAAEPHLLSLDADPTDVEALDAVFRSFHSVKGTAGFMELHDIAKLAHEAENMLDKARDGKLLLDGDAMELALESLDALKRHVAHVHEAIISGRPPCHDSQSHKLIEALRSITAGTAAKASQTTTGSQDAPLTHQTAQPTSATPPPRANGSTDATTDATISKQTSGPTDAAASKASSSVASRQTSGHKIHAAEAVKVDRHRLDELIDLIGELVIAESMVHGESIADETSGERDSRNRALLRKITRELQELSLSLRMIPINGLFQKMARLVRDLSKKLDKPIDFVIEGGETELDKTVVDQVADPLVHIVRNAVDHGIEESGEARVAAGKPERATVTLRAFHRGGNIYIEIQDDGRGLDRDQLVAKARERGLIREDQHLSDHEAYNLIFAPGFSTAKQVTDVSGRGVGMDVVRRNIESLRGGVEIDSKFGSGTTISLRLPLTLAIIDGMVVMANGERFIIPTPSIIESIRATPDSMAKVTGRGEMIAVRGQNVPFFRLGTVLAINNGDREPAEGTIILVEDKGRITGLFVDQIIGRQQVVIKSLGTLLGSTEGYAGCAVMPDGRVGLIIDVHDMLVLARSKRKRTAAIPV